MDSEFLTRCITTGTTEDMQRAMLRVFEARAQTTKPDSNRENFRNMALLLAMNRKLASSLANELLVAIRPQVESVSGCFAATNNSALVQPALAPENPKSEKPKKPKVDVESDPPKKKHKK